MENLQPTIPPISPTPKPSTPPSGSKKFVIASVFIVLVLLSGVIASGFILQQRSAKEAKARSDSLSSEVEELKKRTAALEEPQKAVEKEVEKDAYQAVFVTNGQVYFGKITQVTKDTIKLEDIYYLRSGSVDQSGNTTKGTDLALVKLGNEIHSPKDLMIIERKNITFWENLKATSKVSQAIDEFKKTQPQ